MSRRRRGPADAQQWSRQKMITLLVGVVVGVLLLVIGLVLAVVSAVTPARTHAAAGPGSAATSHASPGASSDPLQRDVSAEDALASRPMPTVGVDASHPAPVSTRDPGTPILIPAPTSAGPAGVPTGYPHTPSGAMAQLAAIDQAALQSGSLAGARAVIRGWALPGGPTATSWSGVTAMADLLNAAGLSGGGSAQLALVLTPLMGLVKGSVGPDFVVPCIDFELDVTLTQTARGATADCQRMVWTGQRWLIGPGAEPATPPSVWPGTDNAISVGYRDLRQDTRHG